jgi:hypothetical protein
MMKGYTAVTLRQCGEESAPNNPDCFIAADDPIAEALVAGFNRPGMAAPPGEENRALAWASSKLGPAAAKGKKPRHFRPLMLLLRLRRFL